MIEPMLLNLTARSLAESHLLPVCLDLSRVALPLIPTGHREVMETLQFIAYLTDGRASYLPPCSLLFTHQAKLGFWEKSSLSGIMAKVKDKNKTGEISSSGHTQPVFLQTQENIPLWRALFIHWAAVVWNFRLNCISLLSLPLPKGAKVPE